MCPQLVQVLLVEDDEDDYYLTTAVIQSIDRTRYQIVWCNTFQKAVDALSEQSFDVALVDYRIGGETGLEFVKVARANGFFVPMILLTGLRDRDIDIAASEVGALDYLSKHELTPALVERSIRFACANAERTSLVRQVAARFDLDGLGVGELLLIWVWNTSRCHRQIGLDRMRRDLLVRCLVSFEVGEGLCQLVDGGKQLAVRADVGLDSQMQLVDRLQIGQL